MFITNKKPNQKLNPLPRKITESHSLTRDIAPRHAAPSKQKKRTTRLQSSIFHSHTKFICSTQSYAMHSVQLVRDAFSHYGNLFQSKKEVSFLSDMKKHKLYTENNGTLSCRPAVRPLGDVLDVQTLCFATGSTDGVVQVHSGQLSFRRMDLPAEVTALEFLGKGHLVTCFGDVIQKHDFVRERITWSTHGSAVDSNLMSSSQARNTTELLASETHTDRITRVLNVNEEQDQTDLFVSASYDKSCILWDTRLDPQNSVVQKFIHDRPVETIIHGRPNQIITCGGTYFRVWDIRNLANGPLLTKNAHQNTITDAFYMRSHRTMFTTSLDEHINFYDTNEDAYSLLHTIKLPQPLLGAAVSPTGRELVAVSAGKEIYKSHAQEKKVLKLQKRHTAFTHVKAEEMLFSPLFIEQLLRMSSKDTTQSHVLKEYDHLIKRNQFKKALTQIVQKEMNNPILVATFIEQMRVNRYTHEALANRNDVELLPVLVFVNKYISHPRFTKVLLRLAEVLIEIYGEVTGQSKPVDEQFKFLRRNLNDLLRQTDCLRRVGGMYEMFLYMRQQDVESGELVLDEDRGEEQLEEDRDVDAQSEEDASEEELHSGATDIMQRYQTDSSSDDESDDDRADGEQMSDDESSGLDED